MLKLVLTGIGGQGIITASIILAEAAVIEEGRFATQSQSYGAEARGGLTRTDIIISNREVLYPKIEEAHVLAAIHQRGYSAYAGTIRPGGLLIYDASAVSVEDKMDARRVAMPILESGRGANITLLGIICELTNAASREALLNVIRRRYGDNSHNEEAFERGRQLVLDREIEAYPVGNHTWNS